MLLTHPGPQCLRFFMGFQSLCHELFVPVVVHMHLAEIFFAARLKKISWQAP